MSVFEEELTSLSIPFSAQIISKCAQQQATCVMHLLYEQRGETAWKEFGFSDTACRMLLDLQELVQSISKYILEVLNIIFRKYVFSSNL